VSALPYVQWVDLHTISVLAAQPPRTDTLYLSATYPVGRCWRTVRLLTRALPLSPSSHSFAQSAIVAIVGLARLQCAPISAEFSTTGFKLPENASGLQRPAHRALAIQSTMLTKGVKMPARQLISTTKAALLLNVSPSTVRQFIADGKFKGYKVGRLVKVNAAEIEAYLDRVASS
jgi:excisionase family DNA binding protein